MIPNYETRYLADSQFEYRALPKGFRFSGYAAVFNKLSEDLGGFVEDVAPSAFNKTMRESDIRALWNHDANVVLGRTKSGTLRVGTDSTGFHYEADAPDTTAARDLAILMERGDVTQSSFGFETISDIWGLTANDYPKRTLLEVRAFDVSPVTFPAYEDATSGVSQRALGQSLKKHFGISPSDVFDLRTLISGESKGTPTMGKARLVFSKLSAELREGKTLSAPTASVLQSVLDALLAADTAVDQFDGVDDVLDQALADLSALMGVPNPDPVEPEDAEDQANGEDPMDENSQRGADQTAWLYQVLSNKRI